SRSGRRRAWPPRGRRTAASRRSHGPGAGSGAAGPASRSPRTRPRRRLLRGPVRRAWAWPLPWWSFVHSSAGELLTRGEVRSQLVVEHRERRADRHVHVEVLVGAETAPEQHHGLLLGQLA